MAGPVHDAIQKFEEHLGSHDRYLLTTHVGPDGDGLGSALGLASLIRQKGKEATVVIVDPLPDKFAFMLEGFPDGTIRCYPQEVGAPDLEAYDAIVLLDCGVWTRLGPLLEAVDLDRMATVCIDHHISEEDPAELTILDETATATASLIYQMYQAYGLELGKPEATALYVSLMTETGSFRFSNTDAEVHRVVADLMETGVPPHDVYVALYENKPKSALSLVGFGLANLETRAGGKVVYTALAREAFDRYGACNEDADGLVNQILALDGAEVAVLLYERAPGVVKVSFRAKNDVDVQKLAAALGGGGHRKAAGATFEGALADAVEKVLELAVPAVGG